MVLVCTSPDTPYTQYRETHRLIDEGHVGQVCFARVRSSYGSPSGASDGWPFGPTWFYQPDGGPLFDVGAYGIHEITSLLGPARRVSTFGGITETVRAVRGMGPFDGLRIPVTTPDDSPFTLDFGNSIFAAIDTTSDVLASKTPKVGMFGRWGAMTIYHRDKDPFEVFVQDLEPGVDARMALEDLSRVGSVREQELCRAMLMEHLVDCVRSDEPPIAGAYKARHVLEIMIAAIESAKSG